MVEELTKALNLHELQARAKRLEKTAIDKRNVVEPQISERQIAGKEDQNIRLAANKTRRLGELEKMVAGKL